MASFFKGSCFIFWITWLLCLSYWMGTGRFYVNHVMDDKQMTKSILMMYAIIVMNISFGFIGCLFLKCNVNNICCVLLYSLPVGIILPIMSGYSAYDVSKNHKVPNPDQVFKLVQDYFEESKFQYVPIWLTQTEREYKCCGIRGPTDYRKLLQASGKCEQVKLDVPCACCAYVRGEDPEETDQGRALKFDSCYSGKNNSRCIDDTNTRNWMEEVFVDASGSPLSLTDKCDATKELNINIDLIRTPNETGIMFNRSCWKNLETNYNNMKACQVTFFVMFAVCPFLMFVAYIRYFCKSSVITGHRSDYSLDVETLSMIETPFSDPLPYLSKKDIT